MFGLIGLGGPYEALIFLGIVLLLFGNRVPGMMRSLGSSITEFKKGVHQVEDQSEDKEN